MLVNDSLDCVGNGFLVADINLGKLNWYLGTSELMKLSSGLVTKLLIGVENNNGLRSSLNTSPSHVVTKATSTTIPLS